MKMQTASFIFYIWFKRYSSDLSMSSSSNDTSFLHDNWMEGEVMNSKLRTCMCNLPIVKKKWFSFDICKLSIAVFIILENL